MHKPCLYTLRLRWIYATVLIILDSRVVKWLTFFRGSPCTMIGGWWWFQWAWCPVPPQAGLGHRHGRTPWSDRYGTRQGQGRELSAKQRKERESLQESMTCRLLPFITCTGHTRSCIHFNTYLHVQVICVGSFSPKVMEYVPCLYTINSTKQNKSCSLLSREGRRGFTTL